MTIRSFIGSILLLVNSCALASHTWASETIGWDQLPDPAVQQYEDPYLDLQEGDLELLKKVARLRTRVASGKKEDPAKLLQVEDQLKQKGIDADYLISQRWAVAERREKAATAGNPAVDGKNVKLAGFVIPAPADEKGNRYAYLVEVPGMCSHLPPPYPNQLIRLHLLDAWEPSYTYQPVQITGRLQIDPTQLHTRVVDGVVPMKATWRLDVAEAKAGFHPQKKDRNLSLQSRLFHLRGAKGKGNARALP